LPQRKSHADEKSRAAFDQGFAASSRRCLAQPPRPPLSAITLSATKPFAVAWPSPLGRTSAKIFLREAI
jgi:hypothetical protein